MKRLRERPQPGSDRVLWGTLRLHPRVGSVCIVESRQASRATEAPANASMRCNARWLDAELTWVNATRMYRSRLEARRHWTVRRGTAAPLIPA